MSVHIKKREIIIKNGRNRASRPKTFKSQEAAKAYAEKEGIKKFEVVDISVSGGKFKVVEQ